MNNMTPDQLLQKAKEIEEEIKFLESILNYHKQLGYKLNYIIASRNILLPDEPKIEQRIDKLKQQAKSILTSIENQEIEGCNEQMEKYDLILKCGNWLPTEFDRIKLFCPSCQQKINEAEKILREVLE